MKFNHNTHNFERASTLTPATAMPQKKRVKLLLLPNEQWGCTSFLIAYASPAGCERLQAIFGWRRVVCQSSHCEIS